MAEKNQDKLIKTFLSLDLLVCAVLIVALLLYFIKIPFLQNELILAIISIVPTIAVFFSAIQSLKNKKISIELLASIALVVSLFQREWIGAIFINLMIASARVFGGYVKIKSRSAIQSLLKLKPKEVKIKKDGKTIKIPLEQVKKGDEVIIELGETVPVDGLVEKGEATIDQSSLTGEAMPVLKKKGDMVLSFTTVVSGNLIILADKVGKETTFEKIISLVEQSQAHKAPINTLMEKFASWYIVLALGGASLVYFFSRDLNLVAALLLISCADDVAIATPLALMSAIRHSASHGAVIKGGDYLEGLAKVKTIIFDKTGTLTLGKLQVANIFSFSKYSEDKVLEFAAAASFFSSHPIARAIINFAKERNIAITGAENFEEHSGKGMSAYLTDKKIIVGKLSFLKESKIKIKQQQISEIKKAASDGLNATLVSYEGELIGCIVLADKIKPKIKETIEELKNLGIKKIAMVTGDNEKSAQKIAKEAGIDELHANLLPEDKLNYLKGRLNKKDKVAMVGDGVNDAPVLAMADIGIAMGAIGSDAAIESADIAMMKDDLSQLPELIKISRSALKVIGQNLILWGIFNVIGFALVFLHILNPSGAAAYNFISDFFPILNSLKLLR